MFRCSEEAAGGNWDVQEAPPSRPQPPALNGRSGSTKPSCGLPGPGSTGAGPRDDEAHRAHCSRRPMNSSNASGCCNESRLTAFSGCVPAKIFFTGTSSFLPLSVRGTSATGM